MHNLFLFSLAVGFTSKDHGISCFCGQGCSPADAAFALNWIHHGNHYKYDCASSEEDNWCECVSKDGSSEEDSTEEE